MYLDDTDPDTARLRRRVEAEFWRRSRDHLRGGPRVNLKRLYAEIEDEVLQEAAGTLLLRTGDIKAPPAGPVTERNILTVDFTLKGADADDSVEGYASTFGNLDLVKDVIHEGAFSRTLGEAKAFARTHGTDCLWPLLWQHDKLDPIGGIMAAHEDGHGLYIKCRINRDIEHGRAAYDGFRGGYMSFSIGYKPVKYEWKANVRHLTDIGLGEISAVTFPANPEARATSHRQRAA